MRAENFAVASVCAFASEEQRVVEKIEAAPAQALNPALPTLWVAGDSTAANGNPNATGWGKPLPGFFDLTKINVANRARGGRSSRTFVTEGLWDQIVKELNGCVTRGRPGAGAYSGGVVLPRQPRIGHHRLRPFRAAADHARAVHRRVTPELADLDQPRGT